MLLLKLALYPKEVTRYFLFLGGEGGKKKGWGVWFLVFGVVVLRGAWVIGGGACCEVVLVWGFPSAGRNS